MKIDIDAAKTHLSHLIDRAISGENVVITRDGRPLVRLVSAEGLTAYVREQGTRR